jgi:hypothetical protein
MPTDERILLFLDAQIEERKRRLAMFESQPPRGDRHWGGYKSTILELKQFEHDREKLLRRIEDDRAEASRNDKAAETVESKATSRKPKKGDPEVAKRAVVVRSNPNTPANDLCEIFDRNNVPLPAKWQAAGFKTWSQAYRDSNYRSKIQTVISKHRQNN